VGFQVGGVDYITKPFNPMVVRARVQTHLELKAVWDALRDENARLESRVEARTAQLQAVLDRLRESAIDTVLRLGLAAEYKDDQTGRHVLRMAHYAVAVARQLGWNAADLDRLFHAALMHDIGKLAFARQHLAKGRTVECRGMGHRETPPSGGRPHSSGSDSEIIQLAEIVALTHHEKWDGSGYRADSRERTFPWWAALSQSATCSTP